MSDENTQPVILQVLPAMRGGGVERGTIEIARAIIAAGGKAIVAAQGGPMLSQLIYTGATHVNLPMATKNPIKIWLNSIRLAKLIRKHGVHVVHARSRAPAWSAWIAARKTGTHFMTTFHGTYKIQNKWKQRYNAIMTRGERIIAISHFIADHIQKKYHIDPARIRIVHRGFDAKMFHPDNISPPRMIALSQEWRLPEDLPLILFPGRITRWKGQDVFIRALAKLPHRHFFAVLLGDDKGHDNYRRELEQLITDVGLAGHVRLARHTHHITEAYRLSKIVVATSLAPEAFGRVVLESQAMGRPVIATNHGGPMETVIPEVTGWLVKPGDVDGLSKVMENALALDDKVLGWMGDQAVANAQQFSLDAMCQKTIDVYEEFFSNAQMQAEQAA